MIYKGKKYKNIKDIRTYKLDKPGVVNVLTTDYSYMITPDKGSDTYTVYKWLSEEGICPVGEKLNKTIEEILDEFEADVYQRVDTSKYEGDKNE